ncbi:MAG: hypothetical protein RIB84_04685 [Sneathiellaceae bacterium]
MLRIQGRREPFTMMSTGLFRPPDGGAAISALRLDAIALGGGPSAIDSLALGRVVRRGASAAGRGQAGD